MKLRLKITICHTRYDYSTMTLLVAMLILKTFSLFSAPTQYDCTFDRNNICSWSQDHTDVFDWTVKKGSTSSAFTGPSFDHTTSSSNGKYGLTTKYDVNAYDKNFCTFLHYMCNMSAEFFFSLIWITLLYVIFTQWKIEVILFVIVEEETISW